MSLEYTYLAPYEDCIQVLLWEIYTRTYLFIQNVE